MWILKRKCPNCNEEISIQERKKLIIKQHIKCHSCEYVLQPTIYWTVMICFILALFFSLIVFTYFKHYLGRDLAVVSIFILVFLGSKLLDMFAALKAHDENEVI